MHLVLQSPTPGMEKKKAVGLQSTLPLATSEDETLDARITLKFYYLLSGRWQVVHSKMLSHCFIWNRHLGYINSKRYRLAIQSGARSCLHRPYSAEQEGRATIEKIWTPRCKKGVIEPSKNKWIFLVVLVSTPDGSGRFCIKNRRLNAIKIWDTFLIWGTDGCVDIFGEATFFSTLDTNSGYLQISTFRGRHRREQV